MIFDNEIELLYNYNNLINIKILYIYNICYNKSISLSNYFFWSYMIKTKHAIKRMQKRGINDNQVELLEKYGIKKRQKQHWRDKNSQAVMVYLNKTGKKIASKRGLNPKLIGMKNLETGAWITFFVPYNNRRIRNY